MKNDFDKQLIAALDNPSVIHALQNLINDTVKERLDQINKKLNQLENLVNYIGDND